MAEVFDATSCRRVSLDEALTTDDAFCRVLQAAGGEVIPSCPMLWPADLKQFGSSHAPEAAADVSPDVDIHFVRDAVIGGFGGSVLKDGRYVFNESSYPSYAKYFIEQGVSEPFWTVEPKEAVHVPGPVCVISHFNPIYGHWLLELFPKLFGVAFLAARGVVAPIVLPSVMPDFMRVAIGLILPNHPIVEYDYIKQTVHADRVILPGMMHRDYVFNACFTAARDGFVTQVGGRPGRLAIFVSRSGLSGKFREAVNLQDLDDAAVRLGLTVVRPEQLSWVEQIRLFASARVVVGEFGSGMHNTIFSPAGTQVVCLNIMNNVQSRIAQSFRQEIGYILDPDGKPRVFSLDWQEPQTYAINVASLEAKVRPLMD